MATVPLTQSMSVEDYLKTVFRPDVDYVDGWIEERNLGQWDHARLQAVLVRLLGEMEDLWGVYAVPEVRVQVAATRFRIPDVCITDARLEVEQIVRTPPLLCVEVVSPDDRLTMLLERAKDFHRMGVARVWVFDPETEEVWVSSPEGAERHPGGDLSVPGTRIVFNPDDAFARAARRH